MSGGIRNYVEKKGLNWAYEAQTAAELGTVFVPDKNTNGGEFFTFSAMFEKGLMKRVELGHKTKILFLRFEDRRVVELKEEVFCTVDEWAKKVGPITGERISL